MNVLQEPVPPQELITQVGGQFVAVGEEFLRHATVLGGLKQCHAVLDVACGCGRMALPMTRYLDEEASYDGFDVSPAAIAWCREHIAAYHPRFRFTLADIRSETYNPGGRSSGADYTFPYPGACFDFAIAASIFTHLLPDEMENYLYEISRVLKPGGRLLSTWFLWNNGTKEHVEAGRSKQTFGHIGSGCRLESAHMPDAAVCYDESTVRALFAKAGLQLLQPIHFGGWRGQVNALSYQDVIVATRTTEPSPRRRWSSFLSRLRRSVRSMGSSSAVPPNQPSSPPSTALSAPGRTPLPDFASGCVRSYSERFRAVPEHLIHKVNGTSDEKIFLDVGLRTAGCLLESFGGLPRDARLLDFGCGLGRILRSMRSLWPTARITGFDVDPLMLQWGRYLLQEPDVPLLDSVTTLPVASFDGIYAISVFTHLDATADYWLAMVHRLLEPSGKAFLTFLDETLFHEQAGTEILPGTRKNMPLDSCYVQGRGAGPDGGKLQATYYATAAWEKKLGRWFHIERTVPRGLFGHQSITVVTPRAVQTDWHGLQQNYIRNLEQDLTRALRLQTRQLF